MKKTKKALASLAIAGMTLTMVPFNVFAAGTVPTRLAGTTAAQTAVKIADQTGWTGTAILASSASYGMVDALTAGPLAKFLNAPILLQEAGAVLNADTKASLTKLAVKKVYVTSGTAVISQAVITELTGMGITVESLGGVDRFETSVNIAKKMVALGAPVTKVAVAFGWLNQDALSISAIAAYDNQPILLTEKNAVPPSVKAFLVANTGIVTTDVIGGTGVISDAVKAEFPNATRHFGNTAYDTNNQVIQDFASSLTFDNVYVANGVTAIDALAGAPLAAMTKSPIVLTDGVTSPKVAAYTYSKATANTVTTALGGTAVVPEQVRLDIAAGKVTSAIGDLAITSVSALDDTNRYVEIVFSKAVSGIQASDITIANADTQERYGVKAVTLSSDGTIVTAELFAPDADTQVLEYLQDYNVTVNVNGTVLSATFNRSYSIKTRVVDINVSDKEIVVLSDKTTSQTDEGDETTITIPDNVNFDYQAALGELVQVWYNGDNELTKYKLLTTNSKVDSIEVKDADTITLLGEDEDYDISTDEFKDTNKDKFTFTLNGNDNYDVDSLDDLVGQKFNFAKVGFDTSGDIESVSAYSLKDSLVYDAMDDDEVVGLDGSTGSFDGADATIVKDGKVIAAADLVKGDLVLFNEDADGDNVYAEVVTKKAAVGPIDEVYNGSIQVDGETYDYDYASDVIDDFDYSQEAVYINGDGDVDDIDEDAADELQAAGDVALYTDYAGNLLYVSGDTAEVDSNSKVAVLTDDMVGYTSARDKVEIEALSQDGDELSYDMSLESFDTITVDGIDYDIDNDTDTDSDYSADLITGDTGIRITDNTDNTPTVGEGSLVDVMFTGTNVAADTGSLVKLHLDDNGTLKELEFFNGNTEDTGYNAFTSTLESGDTYLDGYKLTSNTLLFDGTEDGVNTDGPDYVVSNFSDYNGSDIPNGNFIYNDDQEVIAVWYGATNSDNITYQEAVVTKVLRNTDDEVVSISGWVSGKEQTFEVDQVDDNFAIVKGSVAILEFDEDNDTLVQDLDTDAIDPLDQYSDRVTTGWTVDTVDSGAQTVTLTKGSTTVTYKLADDGLVLDGTDVSDITKEALSDLKGETNVTVVLDSTSGLYTKFFIIGAGTTTPVGETGLVTANNATSVVVDGTTTYFTDAKTILKDKDAKVLAIGSLAVTTGLTVGDKLEVSATDGVATTITIVNTKEELDLATAKAAALTKVQATYTATSWTTLTNALALPEVTATDITDKTTAINNAVTGLVAKAVLKAITAFDFPTQTVAKTIDETAKTITLNVATATDVTALVATFTNSALATVTVGGTAQVSGITANNFTSPVTYTVTAENGTSVTYTVTVIIN